MFRALVLSAAAAGLAAGLVVAALQHTMTTPIILEAEVYEDAGGSTAGHDHAAPTAAEPAVAEAHDLGAQSWAPGDGLERTLYTSLSTVVLATGCGLVLLAAMTLLGVPITGRTGLLFGVGGFVAVALAPAIGLPPELPGSAAADLANRQLWWAFAVGATAAGLAALFLSGRLPIRIVGIALIALPHIVGAPQPDGFASPVPGELSGHFAVASLAVAAVLWTLVGFLSGTIHERLARAG